MRFTFHVTYIYIYCFTDTLFYMKCKYNGYISVSYTELPVVRSMGLGSYLQQ
jgi:hypothetical protein